MNTIKKLTDYQVTIDHENKWILLKITGGLLTYAIKNSLDTIDIQKSTILRFFSNYNHLFKEGWSFYILNYTEGHNLIKISDNNKKYNLEDVIKYFDYKIKIVSGNLIESKYNIPSLYFLSHSYFIQHKKRSYVDYDIKKRFIYLNRIPKIARVYLFKEIMKHNILDNSFYSWNADNKEGFEGHEMVVGVKNKSIENFNYEPGDTYCEWADLNEYYKHSFCTILTESEFDDDIIFITEKLLKSIINYHPFISLSAPNYLKKLHELGFKTFDKWWDESYDTEIDLRKRILKIVDTLNYINNFSDEQIIKIKEEIKPIVLHNLNNLKKIEDKYPKYFEYKKLIHSFTKINHAI